MARSSDHGFFGPGSATWRIHSHPCMFIGGVRALLVQALNPRAIAAVAQHSSYRDDPWGRLMATSEYLAQTTFGDTRSAERAAARVRAIHKTVRGVDDFTGLPYSAEDPELLLWIHAAEVHSFLTGYRYFGAGLDDADADAYVREMVVAAELVGLAREDVPASYADLRAYLRAQEMVASPAAIDAMRFILFPPVPWPGGRYPQIPGGRLFEIPGRAAWSIPSASAVAILPERARRAYRLPRLRPLVPALQLAMPAFLKLLRTFVPPPPSVARAQRQVRSPAA